jgi:hypothetical protein
MRSERAEEQPNRRLPQPGDQRAHVSMATGRIYLVGNPVNIRAEIQDLQTKLDHALINNLPDDRSSKLDEVLLKNFKRNDARLDQMMQEWREREKPPIWRRWSL